MENRVRELEMALFVSQSRISGDVQPLSTQTDQDLVEPPLLNLWGRAGEAYGEPNVESSDQALSRELAQDSSGDEALLDNTGGVAASLPDSIPGGTHSVITGFPEEFCLPSEAITPVSMGQPEPIEESTLDPSGIGALPSYGDEEQWEAYLAFRGLQM